MWAWRIVYRNALEGSIMSEHEAAQQQEHVQTSGGTEIDTTTPAPDTGEAPNDQPGTEGPTAPAPDEDAA